MTTYLGTHVSYVHTNPYVYKRMNVCIYMSVYCVGVNTLGAPGNTYIQPSHCRTFPLIRTLCDHNWFICGGIIL